ncbi:MAG: 50S ribosomal protein L23 [Elusimicrobia bacterium]|nr:50S ribosomal protein L23 [Elusimicrobiota bacterium]
MQINPHAVVLRPILTERTTWLKGKNNQYAFEVALESTKGQIKVAVEQLFKVKVDQVRTSRVLGKMRRMGRNSGYRSDWKKALVRLKEGQKIDINSYAS